MDRIKVVFQPSGKSIFVPRGITIKETLILAGIEMDFSCGGSGRCGKCKIEIKEGLTAPNSIEKELLSAYELKKGIRLACQTKVIGDITAFIPKKSLLERKKNLVSLQQKKYPFNPYCKKPHPNYGLALDIGTTTVVGLLVDLTTGKEVAVVSETNPQSIYGADVISRVNYAINHTNGLYELQQKIIEVINKIINKLTKGTAIKNSDINDVTVVGNTVMQHLLLGLSVNSLATLPFEPSIKNSIDIKAKELKIDTNPEANVYIFPNIGGFVGGDTVGIILTLDLHNSERINLSIDIGTNGEIVMGSKEKLLCASTAAGPAFEGANISCGIRAEEGAIEAVYIANEGIFWRTIGHIKAKGICGSGLIDTVAELLKFRILDETGRIKEKKELETLKLPSILLSSIIQQNTQKSFVVTGNNITDNVFITQEDIRKLQLAKAAIYSGVEILKKELGVNNDNIDRLFIAGTFGNYIDKKNSQIIGLIPQIPLEKVIFVGNAALEGAKLALISNEARKEINIITQKTEHIKLSIEPDFITQFANAIFFPQLQT